ncbi:MAG: 50S ribosomal protein L21 [Gammaproteobacteria bacterium]|nr:50S ribosomal protein L21 [Gammaproteobacteria bacterium]
MDTTKEIEATGAKQKGNFYAVFESGGKQHIARLGATIALDRLVTPVGEKVVFEKVLMVSNAGGEVAIGAPYVEGQQVEAKVLEHSKGPKIRVIKFKRRKHHLKRGNERRCFTYVEISAIDGQKAKPEPKVAKSAAAKATAKPAAAKATAKPAAAKATAKPAAAKATAKPKESAVTDKPSDNKEATTNSSEK